MSVTGRFRDGCRRRLRRRGNHGRDARATGGALKRIAVVATLLSAVSFAVGAPQPEDAVEEIEIVAQRFHFTPSKIKVKSGTRVRFVLESRDTFHGFRVEDSGINVLIPARGRGRVAVEWTAPERGRYRFACSKPCGAGHNQMKGWIIVE